MNKLGLVLCALVALSLTLGSAVTAVGKSTQQKKNLTAEIVSVDAMARTITIKEASGEAKTFQAADKAAMYIRDLTPGERVSLTCSLDDKGEIAKIIKFKPAKK